MNMSIISPMAQITSAPVASGVAWIVNVLLELNIKSTLPLWPDHWQETEEGTEIGKEASEHLRWHLPVLLDRTRFAFEPGLEVIWHHQLDFALHPERPTILYVRDPRDAINSLYVRLFTHIGSLSDYLRRPDSWPYHFPGMFGLPPAETWAYFHLFWMAMGDVMNVKVVTFESMRADPVGVTQDVLAFLGVERSDAEVARALENSTFQRAKEAMEKLQQETDRVFQTNRKGQVGEWKQVYTPTDLLYFDGPAAYAMNLLGYELPDVIGTGREETAFDTRRIPVETDATVHAAIELMTQNCARDAEALLLSKLSEGSRNPWSHAALLNALTSLRWTRLIFTEEHMASAPAQRAFQLFLELNFQFFGYPAIQEALLHGEYGWSDTPCLLENWEGFNIVHFQHTFYGLSHALGQVDLYATDVRTLQTWRKAGTLVIGKTPQEVRQKISRATDAGDEAIVPEEIYLDASLPVGWNTSLLDVSTTLQEGSLR